MTAAAPPGSRLFDIVAAAAERLETAVDYEALIRAIGDSSVVLIGEATHGTEEFYRERAILTRRLIQERGFAAVAVEADWPDVYRANAYVRDRSAAANADEALAGFERFPTWMWRNTQVVDFLEWLRRWNRDLAQPERAVGFYGIDLYSLYRSIEAVIAYLDTVDPVAAEQARRRYGCFDEVGGEAQAYGYAAAFNVDQSCEDAAVRQLMDLQSRAEEYAARDGRVAEDDLFHAMQNARVVLRAEEYYRSMFGGRVSTWNLRDEHMAETLVDLRGHLASQRGEPAKVVVWAHNSHLGDARATEMSARGELNLGQLAREAYGEDSFSIGFTTYTGSVTAASDWGASAERKRVRRALDGSWEDLFHQVSVGESMPRFILDLRGTEATRDESRLERAIGVIYRPETERYSHYFDARLGQQFDAVIHIDETTALTPLERGPQWLAEEPPETYPSTL